MSDLQNHVAENYTGGRRPRNPESTHYAIWPKELEKYRDNWDLVSTSLLRSVPEAPGSDPSNPAVQPIAGQP